VQLEPVLYGGEQEQGRRAGTENIAFMVALGAAAVLAQEQLAESQSRLQQLRDHFQQELERRLPGTFHLNGHPTERLPNTLNVSVTGISGEEVLRLTPEIASSTGSACHEGNTEPSGVLTAMGITRERALGALRLTLGRWTTSEDVDRAAACLVRSIRQLQ
jgi:cysteine desulfurase